ncbi:hypothetical protein IHE31_06620 [Mycetohabitans rhizoxinica]|nr:hypothetical protein [Mycetohabitans sp. B2]MCG1046389.1 hypothetical protein [Mycetohabitans sp. B6]
MAMISGEAPAAIEPLDPSGTALHTSLQRASAAIPAIACALRGSCSS